VLRWYDGDERRAISLPVGGIGTGTIGFGGRGEWREHELQNHPAKGSRSPGTFLAVRAVRADPAGGAGQRTSEGEVTRAGGADAGEEAGSAHRSAPVLDAGAAATARLLEGALFDEEYEGALGSPVALAGLPRFSRCRFEAAYPLGRVCLDDDGFPLAAVVEVFNPFVPGDAEASGRPLVHIRVRLRNTTADRLEASVMCSVANFIGARLRAGGIDASRPTVEPRDVPGLTGVLLGESALDGHDEEWGSFAAAVLGDEGAWRGPLWSMGKWNQGALRMWDGFVRTGVPAPAGAGDLWEGSVDGRAGIPAATFGARRLLDPLGTAEVCFAFSWHFPNRRSWVFSGPGPAGGAGEEIVGNLYCAGHDDAFSALAASLEDIEVLEERTVDFVSALVTSDLPDPVKEAALFNLSTLRSPTFFRSADGRPWGWEGVLDRTGSCPGSCTHVWNYELATPFLFADLARAMREVEFGPGMRDDGSMSFRIGLPPAWQAAAGVAAADGQFGCIVKLYREWQLCGDDGFLARLWPAARRALEFAWAEGSWDADGDGVCEGCQHNTLDVEYFGPNPLVQGWYLAALRAATRMATHLGEHELATRCEKLEEAGSAFTETTLFNGRYYEQQVRPPGDFAGVHRSTRHPALGALDAGEPEFQLGSGCLIDQLAGDVAAEAAGLGHVFHPAHALASLESVHRYNYVPRFADWTNYMRPYALGADRGHVMVGYPDGMPEHPVPYWCEVMTGFEYTYALALAAAGQCAPAVDVVASVRERYDGRRRNPFDEAECGHHYARAMASWGLVNLLAGWRYSAVGQQVTLAAGVAGTIHVFTAGSAWGVVSRQGGEGARIEVHGGRLRVARVEVGGRLVDLGSSRLLGPGDALEVPGAGT
jgi:hypothetical protein